MRVEGGRRGRVVDCGWCGKGWMMRTQEPALGRQVDREGSDEPVFGPGRTVGGFRPLQNFWEGGNPAFTHAH